MRPLFFRSSKRDGATDSKRFAQVRECLLKTIDQINAEHTGLSRRVEEARVLVAFQFGTGQESQSVDTQDVQDLDRAEQTLTTGLSRLEVLDDQLRLFGTMLKELDTFEVDARP